MSIKRLIALLAIMTLAGNCLAQSDNGIIADLEAKAQANDAYAQAVLGRHYLDGYLVEKDDQKASELFWASARQKHPLGLYGVADLVNKGLAGNTKDAEKAKALYQAALSALEPLASQGDPFAQNALGEIYDYAKGVEQNYVEGVKWYQAAADQGLAVAQYNLAYMYDDGQGVEADGAKAISLFQQAAEKGYIIGYYAIGEMYRDGRGVETNLVEAAKWFRKGAEAGDFTAQNWLGAFYRDGKGLEQDYAQAAKWFRKAAEQNYASAQRNLGSSYKYGQGVEKSYAQAAKWFRKAADQGDAIAQGKLGELYYQSQGVERDYAKAAMWLRKAADQGDAWAQNLLGLLYQSGSGVERNDVEGAKLQQKAADQGLRVAQFNMGVNYENGQGVAQSDAEALKWYQLAAAQGHKYAQEKVALMAAPVNNEEAEKSASIKVKGLFIGMDIRTVPAILREKLAGSDWGIQDVQKGDAGRFGGITDAENYYVGVGGGVPIGLVVSGPDLKVISINIGGMLANDMFNAADMEATAFVQQFANAYAIPEMTIADDMQSYVYTSPDGVQVRIDSDKTVVITKVASVDERKKAFD